MSKYTNALAKLNKGLAAINLALSLAGEKSKTELDEGLRQVGVAAGAFSSLGTLVGLPAHMGLYANLYLVPLTKACIAGVQRIAEYIHEENKGWIELFGEPGNYAVEAGGKPMSQFMVQVMRAGDDSQVPTPSDTSPSTSSSTGTPSTPGVGGYEKMPVSGWIFKNLEKDKFRRWLFLPPQEGVGDAVRLGQGAQLSSAPRRRYPGSRDVAVPSNSARPRSPGTRTHSNGRQDGRRTPASRRRNPSSGRAR